MVKSFLQYIQYEKKYSSCTVFSYQNDINQFQNFLSENYSLPIEETQLKHIRNWIISLKNENIESSSINRKLSALKSLFKHGLRNNFIKTNPCTKLQQLKTPKKLPLFFKESELETALDTKKNEQNTFAELRNNIILEILYQTGIRRAELINLKDSDFNFFSLTLRILGKGNKERIIPISKNLGEKTEEYINYKNQIFDSPYFILTDTGEKSYPNLIYRIVKNNMSEVSSLNKRSPHVIRHSFASGLLNNGAEISAVKELLGHANLAATQIYTHTSYEQLKKTYKQAHPRK
ncbi:MAG: tyrosine-type recombinase/integrase [Paludibacteraceae bacterium]|nr:tyrosine-type recombinase/integrase [Paludibacteraceae bacterium]MBR2491981.1 tyrosine-type recombinase/integrase [Paludibacteraceae bacterium]MBR6686186.1 tyrosine-type recombinase/integrase [Paludibacteraceae bacterium]